MASVQSNLAIADFNQLQTHRVRAMLKPLVLSLLSCISIALAVKPAQAAEQIRFTDGAFETSIPIASLDTFVKQGTIDANLSSYAKHLKPKQLQELRTALLVRVDLDKVAVSQFLYTPTGEALLKRLGQVIEAGNDESGFYAIRAALILAAADSQGLTLLNVLHKFPTNNVEIEIGRGFQIAKNFEQLVEHSKQALTVVDQQSATEAAADIPINPAQMTNLRQPGPFSWQKKTITLTYRPPALRMAPSGDERVVLTDLYLPQSRQSRAGLTHAPVIVISHGLGSNRDSLAYLAQHLASYGFAVAVPEHPGSDSSQIQALVEGSANKVVAASEFVDRPLDVKYLLDELERQSQANPMLQGRLNLQQVGVIGQSLGGYTALALAGASLNFPQLTSACAAQDQSFNLSLLLQCVALKLPPVQYPLADPRIKAAIAMNPIDSSLFGQAGISQIHIPTMIVSGSADTIAPALPEQIKPFTWLTTPNKYLVLIHGATHFSLIGKTASDQLPLPPQVTGPDSGLSQRYVDALSVAFFKTYIANQLKYRSYLSAAYAQTMSQNPLPLDVVQSLTEPQLDQAFQYSR